MKNISQDSQYADRDSNQKYPKYKSEALTFEYNLSIPNR
jgi:hypothetical protein